MPENPLHTVQVGQADVAAVHIGPEHPLVLIAGPCVIEGETITLRIAEGIAELCARLNMPWIFKASFDKANRTSRSSFRGHGIDEGLRVLARVREQLHVPVTTDIHLPDQAALAADVVDLLQIPAFLCRQTDLLEACGNTGHPVNLKKGQFLSPEELKPALEKTLHAGAPGVLQTERGTSFGYHNLMVDFRSFQTLRRHQWPVIFDATHSVQLPGVTGSSSGGQRRFIPPLVRAACAAGIDGLFLEVHETPERALSDGPNMVPLHALETLLRQAMAFHQLSRSLPALELVDQA